METNADITNALTPQQEAVADLLATGSTLTDAAQAAGVARQTVSEWSNHNFAFRAEVNRRRNELWRGYTERLRSLIPKALDAVERELDGERALQAATTILKAVGLFGLQVPSDAEEDPKEIEKRQRSLDKLTRAFSDLSF